MRQSLNLGRTALLAGKRSSGTNFPVQQFAPSASVIKQQQRDISTLTVASAVGMFVTMQLVMKGKDVFGSKLQDASVNQKVKEFYGLINNPDSNLADIVAVMQQYPKSQDIFSRLAAASIKSNKPDILSHVLDEWKKESDGRHSVNDIYGKDAIKVPSYSIGGKESVKVSLLAYAKIEGSAECESLLANNYGLALNKGQQALLTEWMLRREKNNAAKSPQTLLSDAASESIAAGKDQKSERDLG